MTDRKALALVAGIATLALTGCPISEFLVEEETIFGVPTGQRTATGDTTGSTSKTTKPGGGGSGGGGDIGETGKTPANVTFEAPLKVAALYPQATSVTVNITHAPHGILVLAEPHAETARTITVNWTGQGGFQQLEGYQTLSTARSESDQSAKEIELRRRFLERSSGTASLPGFQVANLTPRLLTGGNVGTKLSVKVDSVISFPMTVKASDLNGKESRQKFAILLDDADADVFSTSDGATLLTLLKNELQQQIFPTNRRLFGEDPTSSELNAVHAGQFERVKVDSDVTYIVISSKVNDAGRTGVLGFFNLADLLASNPYSPATAVSNQAKVIYLSAAHVRAARGSQSGRHDLFATLAHELQHLLFTWSRIQAVGLDGRIAENNSFADVWIDEGLAMFASAANGYAPEGAKASGQMSGHVRDFLNEAPAYSLTTFYSKRPEGHPTPADQWAGNPTAAYGMAYLFSQYLVDQHKEGIIKKILSSKSNLLDSGKGMTASNINPTGIVAAGLAADGGNFATFFGSFAAALALDGTSALAATPTATQQLYGISGIDLRKVRADGPLGVTNALVQPRPLGVAHLKPSSLTVSNSTLMLTGGAGLSSRLILHQ